jgi:MFS family permease
MRRYAGLLAHRDYALLWSGATISALGDGMSFVALVWLLLEHDADPALVGWLAAAYTAPVVVGGLAAGLVLDRFDRRRVLAADNLVRGIAIASVPVASVLGILTVAQLFVVAGIYGLLFMTSLAGIPSLIPSLVAEDDLTTANALESLSYGIGGLAGPAIAGVVIALLGAPVVLAIDAVSYGIFVACLLTMRPPPEAAPSSAAPTPAGNAGLGPAIRFVVGAPAIVAITVIYMTVNIGEGMFLVLAPIYAQEVIGGGAASYGTLVSAFSAGALGGALLVGAVGWPWPLGRSIAAATLATGLTLGLLLARPGLGLAALLLAVAGVFASSLTAWAQTIRMRLIPVELRGRVFALLRTLMQSTPPMGAILGGFILAGGDVGLAILVMAGLTAVPGAIGLLLPALGREATGERPGVAGRTR